MSFIILQCLDDGRRVNVCSPKQKKCRLNLFLRLNNLTVLDLRHIIKLTRRTP